MASQKSGARQEAAAADPAATFMSGLHEIGEYASHYLNAKVDLARVEVRTVVRKAALAACLAPIAIGVILMGIGFMLRGFAGVLEDALPTKPAIGELLAGSTVVAVLALAALVLSHTSRRRELARMRAKYEGRRAAQLARFGRGVGHGADATGSDRVQTRSTEPGHA